MAAPDETPASLATRILAAALDIAATGQPVFPCWPAACVDRNGETHEAKAPLVGHGFYAATTDAERIARWWGPRWWPWAAIGAPTGLRSNVLDVDCKPGGVNGYVAAKHLRDAGLLDGYEHAVRTASGGLHLAFPVDPDSEPMPNASWSSVGIDLRGAGGYVIAPGSVLFTPEGRVAGTYEVIEQRGSGTPLDWRAVRHLLGQEPAPRPARAARHGRPTGGRIGGYGTNDAALERLGSWLSLVTEGDHRNSALFWAANRLCDDGIDPEPLAEIAVGIGLLPNAVAATLESARRTAGWTA